MRRYILGFAFLGALVTAQSVSAQISMPPPAVVVPLKPDVAVRPFAFTRLYMKLNLGQEWASPHVGLFCLPSTKIAWKTGQAAISSASLYVDALRSEMRSAGFKVDGEQDSLFAQSATSDIQVGALINNAELSYCMPKVGFGSSDIKGYAILNVQWQIYSNMQRTVIAKIVTRGGMEIKTSSPGGPEQLLVGAFRENVRNLIASEEFRRDLTGKPAPTTDVAGPAPVVSAAPLAPIGLVGASQAGPRALSEAIKSVVVVYTGRGQGSGFLASSDGYILTDRHVVGDDKTVAIRWSDGVETVGEVVRSDKVRDVALVKTDPRGRLPLKLGRDPLQPGDTVFAIGTPLDTKFQSTVTRGIISAYRTFGGLRFIQSDVSVNHGNSGGPLLDDKGVVVGLAESSYGVGGVPVDINLFTPVDDAMFSLNLTAAPSDQAQTVAAEQVTPARKMGSASQAVSQASSEPDRVQSNPNLRPRVSTIASGSTPRSAPSLSADDGAQHDHALNQAYLLGEAHAIRSVCSNQADQRWRELMGSIVSKQPPDSDYTKLLVAAFNGGYASATAQFPACADSALLEEERLRTLLSPAYQGPSPSR